MRLLVFSSEFPPGPGGIGTHAHQVASQLALRGWQVTVLASQDYSTPVAVATFNREQPFPVRTLQPTNPAPLEAASRLRALLQKVREQRPDVALASGQRMVWLMALGARFVSLPWVAVGHGTEFGTRLPWQRALSRWAFSQADAVVCVSQYTRRWMLGLGVRPRCDVVIPNGADARTFRLLPAPEVEEFRRRLGLENAPLLLTVGNLTERKGQDVVIRALPRILESVPDAHYLLVGLPTRRRVLADLAERLQVGHRVHFLGRLDLPDVVRAYNACDVYVMTSRHAGGDFEGYGIAAVEAALCGKPAVVTAGSGLAEAVVDGETGLHVPEDDPQATADAVLRLLENPSLRERMRCQARDRALREQTWQARGADYDRVLREVTKAAGTSSRG